MPEQPGAGSARTCAFHETFKKAAQNGHFPGGVPAAGDDAEGKRRHKAIFRCCLSDGAACNAQRISTRKRNQAKRMQPSYCRLCGSFQVRRPRKKGWRQREIQCIFFVICVSLFLLFMNFGNGEHGFQNGVAALEQSRKQGLLLYARLSRFVRMARVRKK